MVQRPTTRFRAFALAAICAASLGLAACGDDDEDTTSSSTTTPATGATGSESTDSGDSGAVSAGAIDSLRSSLEAQGLPQDQVDCAVAAVEDNISDDDLQAAEDALSAGETPDILNDAIEAAQSCLTE